VLCLWLTLAPTLLILRLPELQMTIGSLLGILLGDHMTT
jgi:hypothetical protein